jgi:hypothetical protein
MTNSAAVLTSLAREITEQEQARRACDVKSLMHACRIGQLLLEVKEVAPHGGLLDWLKANTNVTPRMCQLYMTIARDRRLIQRIEREYETVSHLTIAKAVKLARQNMALDKVAENLNEAWTKLMESQHQMASALAEVRQTFDDEGDFENWMVKAVGFPETFAQRIPELLAGEYDDEAWLGAMLADLEARPAGTQA